VVAVLIGEHDGAISLGPRMFKRRYQGFAGTEEVSGQNDKGFALAGGEQSSNACARSAVRCAFTEYAVAIMGVEAGVVSAANQYLPRLWGARLAGMGQQGAPAKRDEAFIAAAPAPAVAARQNTQAEVCLSIQTDLPLWDDCNTPV
jgi:hypothetical protein